MPERRTLTFKYSSVNDDQRDRHEVITLDVDQDSKADFAWLAAAFGLVSTSQVALRAAGCEVGANEESSIAPQTPDKLSDSFRLRRASSAPARSGRLPGMHVPNLRVDNVRHTHTSILTACLS